MRFRRRGCTPRSLHTASRDHTTIEGGANEMHAQSNRNIWPEVAWQADTMRLGEITDTRWGGGLSCASKSDRYDGTYTLRVAAEAMSGVLGDRGRQGRKARTTGERADLNLDFSEGHNFKEKIMMWDVTGAYFKKWNKRRN